MAAARGGCGRSLRYVNARIRTAGDEALLRYIKAPEAYPHNADNADFENAGQRFGVILANAWSRGNMRWLTKHAALAVGREQVDEHAPPPAR